MFSESSIDQIERAYNNIVVPQPKRGRKQTAFDQFKTHATQWNIEEFLLLCPAETKARAQAAACCMQVFYSVLKAYSGLTVLMYLNAESAEAWTPHFLQRLKSALCGKPEEVALWLTNAHCALNAMQLANKIVKCELTPASISETVTLDQISTCIQLCVLCINTEKLRFVLCANPTGFRRESAVDECEVSYAVPDSPHDDLQPSSQKRRRRDGRDDDSLSE
jgi:hypothetical protein